MLVDYLQYKISYLLNFYACKNFNRFTKTFFSNQQLDDSAINQNVVLDGGDNVYLQTLVFSSTTAWLKFRHSAEQVCWLELLLEVQSFSDPGGHLRKSYDTNLMKWTLAEVPSC